MGLVVLAANTIFGFTHLGLGSAITYYTGKKLLSPGRIVGFILCFSLIWGIIVGLLFFVSYPYIKGVWTDIPRMVMIIGLISLPFIFLQNFTIRYLMGILNVRQANIITLSQMLIYLILAFILLYIFNGDVISGVLCFTLSFAISGVIGFLLYAGHAWPLGMIPVSELAPFFGYGSKIYVTMVLKTITERTGIFIIKYFLSAKDVSYYLLAANLGERMWLIPTSLINILLPTLLSMDKHSTKFSAKVCRNNLAIMFFIALLLLLFGKFFIVLLYGEEYAPTAKALYSILWGIMIWPVYGVLFIDFASKKRLGVNMFASFVGAVINVSGTFYLVPRYGFVGAGISMSIANTVMAGIMLVFFLRLGKTSLREVLIPTAEDLRSYFNAFGRGIDRMKGFIGRR